MLIYVARRIVWAVIVVLIVLMITFAVFYLMPAGDPAVRFAGKAPTEQSLEAIRHRLGLDNAWYSQFGHFVKSFVTGDEYGWPGLGYSYDGSVSVRDEIGPRISRTLLLILGASIIWLVVGVGIGVISAVRRRTLIDRAAMGFALFGISAPVFWLGLMGLFVVWKKLHLTGGSGYVPITESVSGFFSHMILPWVVLSLLYIAIYARMTRNNLLETLGEDYIMTARAKGLSSWSIVWRHALRASLAPILTLFGMDVALLVGGAIITESVFNIQGLGWLAITSALNQDLPTVVGVVVLAAIAITFMNLLVDIAYAFVDPRVRYA